VIENLANALGSGERGLANVPGLLERCLREGCWRRRLVRRANYSVAEEVCFGTFLDFVRAHLPEGLETDLRMLQSLCRDSPVVLDLIDAETQQGRGGQEGNRNASKAEKTNGLNQPIRSDRPQKRDRSGRLLRQLRDKHPELHAQVLAKGKTVTEAAIEAGIYPRRLSIRVDDPESAARSILENLGAAWARQLTLALDRLAAPPRPAAR
jgi:hypothetical protein